MRLFVKENEQLLIRKYLDDKIMPTLVQALDQLVKDK